jgi:hypothetical protein
MKKDVEIIRIEIYRQKAWQELPFEYLNIGDRFRPINGNTAGIILECISDPVEQPKYPGLYSVSAKPELS